MDCIGNIFTHPEKRAEYFKKLKSSIIDAEVFLKDASTVNHFELELELAKLEKISYDKE